MSEPLLTTERAPAKINLTLHVTGRRRDGYHLLDSLVVFADIGDTVAVSPAAARSLTVTGPRRAGVPADSSNLVWRAAELALPDVPVAITLEKHLPAAAGIGGGSADAAATLRALAAGLGAELPDTEALLGLGADVPVCLRSTPQRMRGIGEDLSQVCGIPPVWVVLVNPGVDVPTPSVFRALENRENAPMTRLPPRGSDAAGFFRWLRAQRNDLEPPARALTDAIDLALQAMGAQPGCALARMSGSGATCFGVFARGTDARQAEATLRRASPDWWVAAGAVLPPDDGFS